MSSFLSADFHSSETNLPAGSNSLDRGQSHDLSGSCLSEMPTSERKTESCFAAIQTTHNRPSDALEEYASCYPPIPLNGVSYQNELRYGNSLGQEGALAYRTLTYDDGAVYRGSLANGVPHGQGSIELANGDFYTGNFVDGMYHGTGIFRFASGDRYTGDFVNGMRHGNGTMKWANQSEYSGCFVNGTIQGMGTFCFSSGKTYIGNFVDGNYHGRGTLMFADGSYYSGNFDGGVYHGTGIFRFANGDCYTGDFVNGKCHGNGTFKWVNQSKYSGCFVNDIIQGKGTLMFVDGSSNSGNFDGGVLQGKGTSRSSSGDFCTGNFVDGSLQGMGTLTTPYGEVYVVTFADGKLLSDKSSLGDLMYARLLFGDKSPGTPPEYPLGIISDYFKETPYQDLSKLLIDANELARDSDLHSASKRIYEALRKGDSYLLPYGFLDHMMGLNLVPTEDKQFVDCEIFNSGGGLEYHKYAWVDGKVKYETMRRIRVPIEALTSEKIEELLQYGKFPTAKESYDAILSIPGAIEIEGSKVLQAAQKSGNCSLEWIFAFLRNKMSLEDYKKMRVQLFIDCLKQAKENEKSGALPLTQSISREVIERKLHKLLGTDWESLDAEGLF